MDRNTALETPPLTQPRAEYAADLPLYKCRSLGKGHFAQACGRRTAPLSENGCEPLARISFEARMADPDHWRSWLARLHDTEKVTGSSPVWSTKAFQTHEETPQHGVFSFLSLRLYRSVLITPFSALRFRPFSVSAFLAGDRVSGRAEHPSGFSRPSDPPHAFAVVRLIRALSWSDSFNVRTGDSPSFIALGRRAETNAANHIDFRHVA